MLTEQLVVVCTKDLNYEDVLVARQGETYDLLSIGKLSVVIRGEHGMATILSEVELRKHFLVATKGEK